MSAEAELQSGVKTSQRRESRRIKGMCNAGRQRTSCYHGWFRTKFSKTQTYFSIGRSKSSSKGVTVSAPAVRGRQARTKYLHAMLGQALSSGRPEKAFICIPINTVTLSHTGGKRSSVLPNMKLGVSFHRSICL